MAEKLKAEAEIPAGNQRRDRVAEGTGSQPGFSLLVPLEPEHKAPSMGILWSENVHIEKSIWLGPSRGRLSMREVDSFLRHEVLRDQLAGKRKVREIQTTYSVTQKV